MQIKEWSCYDVKRWLISEGFGQYCQLLCEYHEVNGEILLTLTENDLRAPPLLLPKLSDIKKLSMRLRILQRESLLEQYKHAIACSSTQTEEKLDKQTYNDDGKYNLIDQNPAEMVDNFRKRKHRMKSRFTLTSESLAESRIGKFTKNVINSDQMSSDDDSTTTSSSRGRVFFPEYKKLMVSLVYATLTGWVTAFTMVLVHERVPDQQKYPPLPDIFLDNVPTMPFAFTLAELCGVILAMVWIAILLLHKHRAILMRRFCSIASTIFLLRCVTMIVTSLSVPDPHLSCTSTIANNSNWERVRRATTIASGCGMSILGVSTCGDYMFSGHTTVLTLLNHLITEYTPKRLHFLHTASWVLNLFGVFFILAAHEHYSIDVVVAFYITARIFHYYHMLANTRSYWHSKRIRIWFPLLSYFECNVPGRVPNSYEFPAILSEMLA